MTCDEFFTLKKGDVIHFPRCCNTVVRIVKTDDHEKGAGECHRVWTLPVFVDVECDDHEYLGSVAWFNSFSDEIPDCERFVPTEDQKRTGITPASRYKAQFFGENNDRFLPGEVSVP